MNKGHPDPEASADQLAEAMSDSIKRMPIEERISNWRSFRKNQFVHALKQVKKRKPIFVEMMALETGDFDVRDDGYYIVSSDFARLLTDAAHHSPNAYDLAKKICINNLAHKDLQADLQLLCAILLSGKLMRPRPRKGISSANWYRDLMVVRIISSAMAYGINPTRNDVSMPKSGCDLAASIFNEARWKGELTYDLVRKVWDRRDEIIRDYEQIDFAAYVQNSELD